MTEKLGRICFALAIMLILSAVILLVSGCASTNIITEYDTEGRIVKKTETKESVVEQVIASTKDKSVLVWRDGWRYGFRSTIFSTENPLPVIELIAIKENDGVLTIHKDQQNIKDFPSVITAAKNTDPLSATASGVSSGTSSP